jgi:hypothetical protein
VSRDMGGFLGLGVERGHEWSDQNRWGTPSRDLTAVAVDVHPPAGDYIRILKTGFGDMQESFLSTSQRRIADLAGVSVGSKAGIGLLSETRH